LEYFIGAEFIDWLTTKQDIDEFTLNLEGHIEYYVEAMRIHPDTIENCCKRIAAVSISDLNQVTSQIR